MKTKTVRSAAALFLLVAAIAAPMLAATGPLQVTYYYLPG
jgi:hypothetical protein